MSLNALLQSKGSKVHTIPQSATLKNCIQTMNTHKIGALIVVNDAEEIAGIITERDVLHAAQKCSAGICNEPLEQFMTTADKLVTASPDDTTDNLLALMTEKRIRHIPVLSNGNLVGLVSIGDLVKYTLSQAKNENVRMKEYIFGS
jgi:CBS domain-containing protein